MFTHCLNSVELIGQVGLSDPFYYKDRFGNKALTFDLYTVEYIKNGDQTISIKEKHNITLRNSKKNSYIDQFKHLIITNNCLYVRGNIRYFSTMNKHINSLNEFHCEIDAFFLVPIEIEGNINGSRRV